MNRREAVVHEMDEAFVRCFIRIAPPKAGIEARCIDALHQTMRVVDSIARRWAEEEPEEQELS